MERQILAVQQNTELLRTNQNSLMWTRDEMAVVIHQLMQDRDRMQAELTDLRIRVETQMPTEIHADPPAVAEDVQPQPSGMEEDDQQEQLGGTNMMMRGYQRLPDDFQLEGGGANQTHQSGDPLQLLDGAVVQVRRKGFLATGYVDPSAQTSSAADLSENPCLHCPQMQTSGLSGRPYFSQNLRPIGDPADRSSRHLPTLDPVQYCVPSSGLTSAQCQDVWRPLPAEQVQIQGPWTTSSSSANSSAVPVQQPPVQKVPFNATLHDMMKRVLQIKSWRGDWMEVEEWVTTWQIYEETGCAGMGDKAKVILFLNKVPAHFAEYLLLQYMTEGWNVPEMIEWLLLEKQKRVPLHVRRTAWKKLRPDGGSYQDLAVWFQKWNGRIKDVQVSEMQVLDQFDLSIKKHFSKALTEVLKKEQELRQERGLGAKISLEQRYKMVLNSVAVDDNVKALMECGSETVTLTGSQVSGSFSTSVGSGSRLDQWSQGVSRSRPRPKGRIWSDYGETVSSDSSWRSSAHRGHHHRQQKRPLSDHSSSVDSFQKTRSQRKKYWYKYDDKYHYRGIQDPAGPQFGSDQSSMRSSRPSVNQAQARIRGRKRTRTRSRTLSSTVSPSRMVPDSQVQIRPNKGTETTSQASSGDPQASSEKRCKVSWDKQKHVRTFVGCQKPKQTSVSSRSHHNRVQWDEVVVDRPTSADVISQE